MFRRVLVPVDGSTFSEHAIPFATRVAAAFDATLEFALVHVSYQPLVVDAGVRVALEGWDRSLRERHDVYINDLAHRVGTATGRVIVPVVLSGDIVPVLEREIAQRGVDLVVMTTHGRGGLARA